MNRLLTGLVELPHWLWLVAKKWVWLIGLLPAIFDIISTYVSGVPQVQIPWQWSAGIGCLGFLISVYLVYLDLKDRLAVYEDHEPHYALEVLETSSKACRPDQVHIECAFRMIRRNPWPGELIEISLTDSKLPRGIGPGMISRQDYKPLDWHCHNLLKFPYTIPRAGCDFQITIHYPVVELPDLRARKSWESVVVGLSLLMGYETQLVGYIQKCILLDVPVNLGEVFDDLVKSGTEDTQ
jgi:hypothetical protein